jgi:hypothetical protein
MRSLPAAWVLLMLLGLSVGCRPPSQPQAPKNLKEWFQQKEADFRSEDGTIDMESVREAGPETIEYQTVKNGTRKTWRQKYRAAGAGNYERVGDPEDITAKPKTGDVKAAGKVELGVRTPRGEMVTGKPYLPDYRC